MASDPSRTETLTAEQVSQLRFKSSRVDGLRHFDVLDLCDSHEALRAEVARLQHMVETWRVRHEAQRHAADASELAAQSAEAREQATRAQMEKFRDALGRYQEAEEAHIATIADQQEQLAAKGCTPTCIECEGHGVKRTYLDRAGLYTKAHCAACKGTGRELALPAAGAAAARKETGKGNTDAATD